MATVSAWRNFGGAVFEAGFHSGRNRCLDDPEAVGLFESCAHHRLSILVADLEMNPNGASDAAAG